MEFRRWTGTVAGWWVILFGVVTLLAVVSAAHLYVGQYALGKPVGWGLAFRRSFEDWYSLGVLSPFCVWMAARFRFDRQRLAPWLLLHLTGSVVFALAYIALFSWLLDGQRSIEGVPFVFMEVFQKILLHYLPAVMVIYWFVVVGHNGWHYYRQFKHREVRTAELEKQLIQARLETLRMQINPHFLFNTLHTVSALVHTNPAAADKTIVRLGELLRTALDRADVQEIPLAQEMNFLRSYLEIERIRFEDRLEIELRVGPGADQALVPSLILQPLVENAIRHGIEPNDQPGKVSVTAEQVGEKLVIVVADNGPGLRSGGAERRPREGVGLSNTRSRLVHLYGEDQRFEVSNLSPGGVEARLELPFRTRAAAAENQDEISNPNRG